MLTAPTPATAQVDYIPIRGKTGSSACPSGVSERQPGRLRVTRPEPGATAVTLNTFQLTRSWLRTVTSRSLNTSFPVSIRIYDDEGNIFRAESLGTAANTPIAARATTIANLKPGESYHGDIWVGVGGGGSSNIARSCFQMGPRLDYGQQEGFDLGSDPLGATGCFAIGGVRLGGGENAVRACQCGARNSSGQWARTDSADGYEYILPAARRTALGCTTN